MKYFKFTALKENGKKVFGHISAYSKSDAISLLQIYVDLFPISVKEDSLINLSEKDIYNEVDGIPNGLLLNEHAFQVSMINKSKLHNGLLDILRDNNESYLTFRRFETDDFYLKISVKQISCIAKKGLFRKYLLIRTKDGKVYKFKGKRIEELEVFFRASIDFYSLKTEMID